MPRVKKVKTIEERIQETELLIQSKESELATLKESLAELNSEKQQADIAKLYEAISKSGVSVDEVLDLIKDNN